MQKIEVGKKLRQRGLGKFLSVGALFVGASVIPYSYAFALDDNALPSGGTVVGGNASFDYSIPNELHVNQQSDLAVINWNSFNIGTNALTQFHQPGVTSIAVNKVTGTFEPSQILGTLKANGQIVILDQNGVIFGHNSRVDVGGIVASTGDIDNTAFMSGNTTLQITGIDTGGSIVNDGNITVSEAGLAAFVAPSVINNGLIQAKLGRVVLASGTAATVDLYGDGLVEVAPSAPLQEALIQNTGTISAEGGTIVMTAAAARGVVDSVINTSGVVSVASATQKGGKIILEGPSIEVSGKLDASGKLGGGEVLVGGGFQGSGTIRHADTVNVTDSANIFANTTGDYGDGGDVILWSDGTTQFDGLIEAKGGALGGDGGSVETSGKINLGLTGSVDASAPNGLNGEWLLDPSDVWIANSGNSIPGSGGTINPGSDSYYILASSIQTALNNGNNVTITTTSGGSQGGGIFFDWAGVTINKTAGASATLTLKANSEIQFNNSIITASGAGNALNIVAWADYDGTGNDGLINSFGTMRTNGGNIYMVGGADDGANGGIAADGIGDNYASNGISLGADIDAQGGNVVLNGSSTAGPGTMLQLSSKLITSGTGNITIRGISGGAGWTAGTFIQTTSQVKAATGSINITGTNNGDMGAGVSISSGTEVSTSGATGGNITITGTKNNAAYGFSNGVEISGDASLVKTVNGNISITGSASNAAAIDARGISFSDGGDVYSTGSGNISLTGAASSGGAAQVDIRSTASGGETSYIGDTTSTGTTTLNANTIDFSNANTVVRSAAAGKAIVKPRTASTTIGLGGGGGTLNLSDAELGMFNVGTLIIGDSASGSGDMIVDSWNLSGKTHNVELYANDITFQDTAAASYAVNLGTGNFFGYAAKRAADNGVVASSAAFKKSVAGSSTLTLKADDTVDDNTVLATTGSLNVVYWVDADNTGDDGTLLAYSPITTNGGNIYIVGGLDDGANGGTAGDGIGDNYAGNSTNLWGVNYNAGGGNILAQAKGTVSNGFYIGNGSVITTTGNGNITIRGVAGTNDYNAGIMIQASGAGNTISAQNGTITLEGTNAKTSVGGNGIIIDNTNTVYTTGGNIVLTGTRSGSNSWRSVGVELVGDSASVYTTSGTITFNGTASTATDWVGTIGVLVDNGFDIYASGSGNVVFNGVTSSSATNKGTLSDFNTTGTGTSYIGALTSTGTTTFNGDTIDLDNTTTVIRSAAGGKAIVKPRTASTTIGLGGGSGTLNLTDAELAMFNVGTLVIGDFSGASYGDLVVDSWDLSGKTHNVELYGNDITLQDTDATAGVDYAVKLGTGNLRVQAFDKDTATVDKASVNLNAAILKSAAGASTLTLRSDRDIVLNNANITSTGGMLLILMNADRDADQDGAISITNSAITTNDGWFVAGGGSGTLWGADGIKGTGDDAASTGADNVAAWGNASYVTGVNLTNSTINTGVGDIFIKGHGYALSTINDGDTSAFGISLFTNSNLITTGSGNITLSGVGGGTGTSGYNIGFYVKSGSNVQTNSGNINIDAQGGTGSAGINHGFVLSSALINKVTSVNGAININASSASDAGLFLNSTGGEISTSGSGAITIKSSSLNANTANTIKTTGTGNINIATDSITSPVANTISSAQNLLIKTLTSSATIGLGGAAGNLSLSDAVLNNLSVGNTLIIGDSTGTNYGDMVVDSWDLSGKTYNVELYANDINFLDGSTATYAVNLGTGNFLAHAIDKDTATIDKSSIAGNAAFKKGTAGTSTLTLRSDNDITLNNTAITSTNGALNVVLNADRDADQDGAVFAFNSPITTRDGYLVAGGGSGILWGADGIKGTGDDATSLGADNIASYGNSVQNTGMNFTNSAINTGTGDIFLTGQGANTAAGNTHGTFLSGSSVTTTSGNVWIKGTAAGTGSQNYGFQNSSSSTITTGSGSISILANNVTTGTGSGAYGAFIQNNIISTSGSITINATASSPTGGSNHGFRMGSGTIRSGSNTLTITGVRGATGGGTTDFSITGGTIGGAGQTGAIILNADTFSNTGTTISTTNTITLKTRTATQNINLGGPGGGLDLDDSELGYFSAATLIIGDSTGTNYGDMVIDSWDLSGKTYNVELYANDITFQDTDATVGVDYAINLGSGNFLAHAIDKDTATIDKALLLSTANFKKTITGTSRLDLRSDQDIYFNGGGISTTTGSLNVILNSDRDADHDGAIKTASSTMTTNNGWFVAGGGNGTVDSDNNGILGDAGTGADVTSAWGSATWINGISISNSSLSTGNGNIVLTGKAGNYTGAAGVVLATDTFTTAQGNMTLKGYGNIGQSGTSGVNIGATTLTADEGNIYVYGTAIGQGDNTANDIDRAVIVSSSSLITQTHTAGKGAISIIGDASASSGLSARGIELTTATIESQAGNITITGTKGNSGAAIQTWEAVTARALDGGNLTLTATNGLIDLAKAGGSTNDFIFGGANTNTTTIVADNFSAATGFNAATSSILGGTVIFKPYSLSQNIGLGGASTGLDLSDLELSYIKATNKLIIGDSTGTNYGDMVVDSWDLSGKTYNVELYANDITFQDTDATVGVDYAVNLGSGNFLAHAIDKDTATIDKASLNVNTAIKKSLVGTSLLDLRSDQDIIFTGGNITATTGLLNIVLNSDRDADQDGAISVTSSAFTTNGGWFVAGGGSGTLWGTDGIKGTADDSTSTGADNIAAWGNASYANGIYFSNGDVTSYGGNIILNGNGRSGGSGNGVYLGNGSVIMSATAAIKINGTGGSSGSSNFGVYINNGTSYIATTTGQIDITGTGNGTTPGLSNSGITLDNNAKIYSFGSGTINLTGTAGSGGVGFRTTGGTSTIGGSAATGQITFITDTLDWSNNPVIQTTNSVLLKTKTNSTSIGIGGGSGTLSFADAYLGYITASKLIIGDSTGTNYSDINVDSWDLSGKTFDIELYGNDITFQDTDATVGVDYAVNLGSGNFLAHAIDKDTATIDKASLNVNAQIKKSITGTSLLDLRSDRDIIFNAGNITATAGILNTVLNADRDADQDGAISITNSAFTTNDGWFVAGGGSGTLWGTDGIKGTADDATSTGADNVEAWGNSTYKQGIILDNGDINTGAGSINMTGHGRDGGGSNGQSGIVLNNSSYVQSSSGTINIKGTGGAGTWNNYGIGLTDSNTIVGTDIGAINLTGIGGAGSNILNSGISIESSALVTSTGANANNITIDGRGGNGTGSDIGFQILSGGRLTTANADVNITAVGSTNNAGGLYNRGMMLQGGYISSTGTTADAGNIIINATGYSQGGDIYIDGQNSTNTYIETNSGNLAINVIADSAVGGPGIYALQGGTIRSVGSGDITITGTQVTGSSNLIAGGSGTSIGHANMTGIFSIIGDSIDLDNITMTTNAAGSILLKPYSVDRNINLGGPTGAFDLSDLELSNVAATGRLIIGDSTGTNYGDMIVDSWDLSGKTYNVELYGNDITFQDTDATAGVDYGVNLGTGNFLAHAIDKDTATIDKARLSVNARIKKTIAGTSLLDLRADRDIGLIYGITATTGSLDVVLNADRDADQDGAIRLSNSLSIFTNGGFFVAGGGSGKLWGLDGIRGTADDATSTGADNVMAWGNSTYASGFNISNSNISTDAGAIIINGHGRSGTAIANEHGVTASTSTIHSTTGEITIRGTGGTGTTSNRGVFLDTASKISSEKGAIDITGVGGSNGSNTSTGNTGIQLLAGSSIESEGTGSDASTITLKGTAGAGYSANHGIYLDNSAIKTKKGNVVIEGIAAHNGDVGASLNRGLHLISSIIEADGSANITITGTSPNSNLTEEDIVISGTANVIGGATATGTITLNANKFSLANLNVQTSGTVYVKPIANTTTIGLGGGTGDLNLDDAELALFNAGTLIIGDSVNGTGDIDIDSWDLSAKAYHVQVYGNDIDLGGITTGAGNVYLYGKDGNITVSADSNSNAAGNLTLLAGRDVSINEDLVNSGTGKINIFAGWDNLSGITTDALFNLDNIDLAMTARDITIGTNGKISSGGAGTSVLFVASDDFVNNASAAANAITAANGRYLVYASHPDETVKGGLTAKNLYNKIYDTSAPSSITGASRFIYAYQPTLTLKADDISAADTASAVYTFSAASGLRSDDLLADAVSGTGNYVLGVQTGNTAPITMSAGTFASAMGYALAYTGGTLTLTTASPPPPPAPTPTPVVASNSSLVSIINHTTNIPKVSMTDVVNVHINDQSLNFAKIGSSVIDTFIPPAPINMGSDGVGTSSTPSGSENMPSNEDDRAEDAASQEPAANQSDEVLDCLVADTGGCVVR